MDVLLAKAQIGLAAWYSVALVATIIALIVAPPMGVEEFVVDMLKMLLGGLLVLCTQSNSYFFARTRAADPPPQ